jgi:hypothetical protein
MKKKAFKMLRLNLVELNWELLLRHWEILSPFWNLQSGNAKNKRQCLPSLLHLLLRKPKKKLPLDIFERCNTLRVSGRKREKENEKVFECDREKDIFYDLILTPHKLHKLRMLSFSRLNNIFEFCWSWSFASKQI